MDDDPEKLAALVTALTKEVHELTILVRVMSRRSNAAFQALIPHLPKEAQKAVADAWNDVT